MNRCIDNFQSFFHNRWNLVKNKYDEHLAKWCNPILEVVKKILLIVASIAICYCNPKTFITGALLVAVWPKEMKEAILNIKKIWQNNHLWIIALLGVGAVYALPWAIYTIPLISGVAVGLYLFKNPDNPKLQ